MKGTGAKLKRRLNNKNKIADCSYVCIFPMILTKISQYVTMGKKCINCEFSWDSSKKTKIFIQNFNLYLIVSLVAIWYSHPIFLVGISKNSVLLHDNYVLSTLYYGRF